MWVEARHTTMKRWPVVVTLLVFAAGCTGRTGNPGSLARPGSSSPGGTGLPVATGTVTIIGEPCDPGPAALPLGYVQSLTITDAGHRVRRLSLHAPTFAADLRLPPGRYVLAADGDARRSVDVQTGHGRRIELLPDCATGPPTP